MKESLILDWKVKVWKSSEFEYDVAIDAPDYVHELILEAVMLAIAKSLLKEKSIEKGDQT